MKEQRKQNLTVDVHHSHAPEVSTEYDDLEMEVHKCSRPVGSPFKPVSDTI